MFGPDFVMQFAVPFLVNPFMPNEFSNSYQFDESMLRAVEWYFSFLFKF